MRADIRELNVGDKIHVIKGCQFNAGSRGGVTAHHTVWTVTNIVTFKRDPDRRKITIHRGLRGWDYITRQSDVENCELEDHCPAIIAEQNYLAEQAFANYVAKIAQTKTDRDRV